MIWYVRLYDLCFKDIFKIIFIYIFISLVAATTPVSIIQMYLNAIILIHTYICISNF